MGRLSRPGQRSICLPTAAGSNIGSHFDLHELTRGCRDKVRGGGLPYVKPYVHSISSAGDYLGHRRHRSWMFAPLLIGEGSLSFPRDVGLSGRHGEVHQRDFIPFEASSVSYSQRSYCGHVPRWLVHDVVHERRLGENQIVLLRLFSSQIKHDLLIRESKIHKSRYP